MPGAKGKGGLSAAIGEEEYLVLDRLSLPLSKEETEDGQFFTLCFWIYLLRTTNPGLIIRKVFAESGKEAPLLALDENKRLKLYLITSSPSDETTTIAAPADEIESILSDQACPFEKWVHIGCEIYADVVRIHMDGVVVEEKRSFSHSESNMVAQRIVSLAGGDGSTSTFNVQAYVHYVKVMPQAAVTNHYVKNPPLELSLDGSTGATDDHEVEEGGDGIWSVVGGKASCRRNFALDVVLLDALGRSVHKDMELMALLVYADNGTPVEKPKDDAEAPLLTTFDGVEFPSTERPIKLVHGRASFKLKISQLSSKCDNRLFRVCFDSPNTPGYPFLKVYSRPIRCVSRNRNSRAPLAASWRRPNVVSNPVDAVHSPENVVLLESLASSENYGNGTTMGAYAPKAAPLPPTKRARVGPPESHHLPFLIPPNNEFTVSPISDRNAVAHSTTSLGTQSSWPENGHSQHSKVIPRIENTTVQEQSPNERNSILSSRDTKDTFVRNLAFQKTEASQRGLSDYLVFKYCLENMQSRASFLKGAVFCRSDQELNDFAKRVSMLTGCQHAGYQICIARKLVQGGVNLWKQISKDSFSAPWNIVMDSIENQFMQISNSKRRFSRKDSEFLRQVARCDEIVSHEGFDRLWQWIYPVALSVSSPLVRQLWEIEEPKWIEGMVFREEAEELLKNMDSLKPGTFILRFASSRCWPHPDAGALIVTYIDDDLRPRHKLLSLEKISGVSEKERPPLPELLLSQKELSQPYSIQ